MVANMQQHAVVGTMFLAMAQSTFTVMLAEGAAIAVEDVLMVSAW